MQEPSRRDAPRAMDVGALRATIDPIADHSEKIYRAALWYATNGFKVVPFVDWGDKVGYPKKASQHAATCHEEQITKWWHPTHGAHPGAAIAMAHGGKAGYCAIDLDIKKGINGLETLSDLSSAYGDYADGSADAFDTLMATTPSGGRHLVYRYHPEIISNSEVTYPGVDTRGGLKRNPIENGGITFVEPSIKPGTADTRKATYRWDDNQTEIKDMPQWLVDVLNGRPPKKGGMRLQDAYVESMPGNHGNGRDCNIYGDLLRFVGIGYSADDLWGLMPDILGRMDPPDEDMVRRKVQSALDSEAFRVAQTEGERRERSDSMKLDRNDKGHVIKSQANLEVILSSPVFAHEYGDIQFDDFYHNYTMNGKPLAMAADYAMGISIWISREIKVEFAPEVVRKAVEYMAYTKKHANAARDYMFSCPKPVEPGTEDFWGSGRGGPGHAFHRLCTEVMDLGNPDLHKGYTAGHRQAYEAFLWFWLQGAACRACLPGCKMEIMLNMFGQQGIGKSAFFKALCPQPDWFTDSVSDVIVQGGRDIKDELTKMQAKLIVEMPELSPLKKGGKGGDDRIKGFISTQVDWFRRSYGQNTVGHPRSSALCGTSNNNDVYRDSTGDRRFVSVDHGEAPFKLGDQNNGVMTEIRNQLWGEVIDSFRPGEFDNGPEATLVCIPHRLREAQKTINGSHRYEEIGMPEIMDWMEDKTRVTWAEIMEVAAEVPGLRDTKENAIMAAIRQILGNSPFWQFKKRSTRHNRDGDKEKINCWVNLEHPWEVEATPGKPVPPHWSTAIKKAVEEY